MKLPLKYCSVNVIFGKHTVTQDLYDYIYPLVCHPTLSMLKSLPSQLEAHSGTIMQVLLLQV